MVDLNDTQPIFIKDMDWPSPMTNFSVCMAVTNEIDSSELIGAQKIGGLWRIYLKSETALKKLLLGLDYQDHKIPVYRHNPLRTGANSPDDQLIRITLKDLPLSVSNQVIENYLKQTGIEIVKSPEYARARDPDTHQLTSWFNGDRVMFTRELRSPMPRFIQLASFTCRVFHDGQITKPVLCTNCFKTDHTKSKCTNPASCKACKKPGHQPGDESCDAFIQKHTKVSVISNSTEDPLSNNYNCELKVLGTTFNCVEQAYQYSKAIRRAQPDVADLILKTPSPKMAKNKSRLLRYDENWTNDEKTKLMKQLLEAKMEQVPEFSASLLKTGKNTLVLADPSDYDWGSGLAKEQTLHTKKRNWPGKNLLGSMLETLRTSHDRKPSNK
jgi:ribA/ribD-fused uncharacterized protein